MILDLKSNRDYLSQYVALRNKYKKLLLTDETTLEATIHWLDTSSVELYGKSDNNTLIGAVILYPEKGGEVSIFTKNHGKGLGGELLLFIEEIAKKQKLTRLWAWTRHNNIKAQRLFTRCGYINTKEVKRKYNNKIVIGNMYQKVLL